MVSDKLQKIFDSDEHGLLNTSSRAKRQSSSDMLEASFLEIADFYNEHGRKPDATSRSISERKLGARLNGILADEEKIEKLKPLDEIGLLEIEVPESIDDILGSDNLGLLDDPTGITIVRNVPPTKQAAEDFVARRKPVKNFYEYEHLFLDCHNRLRSGEAKLFNFQTERQIRKHHFYVVQGLLAYVYDTGELKRNKSGDLNSRLRVIFENGTESNMLLRSLAKLLYDNGQIVLDENSDLPILNQLNEDDSASGYIYVLKSLSEEPQIANIANLYKIGFTTGTVENRIAHASEDPTYLMAKVEEVARYKTYNLNTQKLENLVHRVLADVKLDVVVGGDEKYRAATEWYVVSLNIIDEVIQLIVSGDIVHYVYDAASKSLVRVD